MDCVPFTDSQCLSVFWLGFYKAELYSTCGRGLAWRQTEAFTCSSRPRSALRCSRGQAPEQQESPVTDSKEKGGKKALQCRFYLHILHL